MASKRKIVLPDLIIADLRAHLENHRPQDRTASSSSVSGATSSA
ncbi:MAG: hypothetical protein JWL58_5450, partial [Streptosporangiaceae bacterium]|nr:hypothetical protein [Streptosporangiaceae bacterium]